MQETRQSLEGDELQTLKELALLGALEGDAKLSCSSLADRLGVSTQTASRRLQGLDEEGYVEREIVTDGQWVGLTGDGERRLRAEYTDYRRVFEEEEDVTLSGTVTSGMGEGRHYISLPGYMRQFREKLDYEPFAGTLNIDLTEESIRARRQLDGVDPITIEGWEDEDRTYGPAYCYPATVSAGGETYDPAHVIAPERTHHGDDHLEVIAPEKLRDVLDLEDGSEVTVDVEKR
ncbi:riboflavin kinase [Halobacteriales archaeon SW_10_68_16]|jgi:riboflavin kinase|nr:MAG: riboflavin kinase [Halobacteriales archaeon SW_10_68_16]